MVGERMAGDSRPYLRDGVARWRRLAVGPQSRHGDNVGEVIASLSAAGLLGKFCNGGGLVGFKLMNPHTMKNSFRCLMMLIAIVGPMCARAALIEEHPVRVTEMYEHVSKMTAGERQEFLAKHPEAKEQYEKLKKMTLAQRTEFLNAHDKDKGKNELQEHPVRATEMYENISKMTPAERNAFLAKHPEAKEQYEHLIKLTPKQREEFLEKHDKDAAKEASKNKPIAIDSVGSKKPEVKEHPEVKEEHPEPKKEKKEAPKKEKEEKEKK